MGTRKILLTAGLVVLVAACADVNRQQSENDSHSTVLSEEKIPADREPWVLMLAVLSTVTFPA